MESSKKRKVQKKLFSVIYGRTAVILLLILIQILVMVFGIYFLTDSWTYLYGVFSIIGTIAVIYIINSEDNPAFKLTWVLCIMALPIFGTFFYIYVKSEIGTRYIGKRLETLRQETEEYMCQDMEIIDAMKESKLANKNLSFYLGKHMGFPIYGNTRLEYYPLGEDKFDALKRELRKAEHFIFMEYFIVEGGEMWDEVRHILEEKVAEGVEVRFMYDGMCSISKLPSDYPWYLRRRGIRCKVFNPINPIVSTIQNNRDHRKICVIDGKVGFTGGVNLADEYINRRERFGHWKDTAIMLEGDAVQSLTIMFLQMWNIDEKKSDAYEKYLYPSRKPFDPKDGYVLPYGDTPYDNETVGEEVYFHILNHAKEYVHIMTPYLILDNEMIKTLARVAKSGMEVIIIMPHIPDKPYAFAVAKTYYKELIEAGARIYEYTPGFVHAKIFVSDDDTATVGTINLDYRSLYLHFEDGVFIYNNPVVADIERDFQETLKKCHFVTMKEVQERSVKEKIEGQVLRLFAPLM
ncbi:cardiolipin synthase [Sellimonas catena]|uniref:cardiolipin synthase n=1 Tax=Sellimonas catena TaxID=2994035 RepID=UPI002491091D|nr:cardiolipin synthase [Sellimonas catena]